MGKKEMFERGLQSKLSHLIRVPRSTMCAIFSGKRRATIRQAAELEEAFTRRGIPLNRWDLLYGVAEGQTLVDYLAGKGGE